VVYWFSYMNWVFNPKPNNLDRRFRIYRETLSRFSCAALPYIVTLLGSFALLISRKRERKDNNRNK
ncbi:hypothetical protein ACTMNS_10145, partial [Staphylococcus haemolyticus]